MSQLFHLDGPLFKFLSSAVDLVILNFLFFLFCIPILTMGASMTALYSVLMKMVRDEEKDIVKSFLLSFKKNFTQSTIVWFIMSAAGFFLFANLIFLGNLSGVPKIFFASMLLIFGCVYLCILLFIFPYMARYEDTIKKSLLNSLLVGLSNFPYLLVLIILTVVPVIFVFSSSIGLLTGLYFGTFGGFALLAFLNSYLFRKAFSKYEVSI
ncbi:YesL family protein [Metabacillus arenae]|uniref:YesL family protein n=1 Tax=Metabacillus arenae TaxID=2771434 RepID=A0A926NP75_9BACI|nr:YesL family protein [Metabacillus arenae]MBD1381537.1 YesL family protein [Metabacillus arenae]